MGKESNSWRQRRLGSLLPLALICLSLAATPTQGMGMCGTRADFVKALNDKYQEKPRSLAIAGQVNLVEVFVSKSGTWTIIVTEPAGKTCIIAAGNSWEDLPPVMEGKDT